MGDQEWAELYVVQLGSHMPRTRNLFVQTFGRMLGLHNDTNGARIIYAEGLDEQGAMELLSVHLMDFAAGRAVFNWGPVMHTDLLANATTRFLDELFPNSTDVDPAKVVHRLNPGAAHPHH